MSELVTTGGVDLHTHTTTSDGELTPSELVKLAKDEGLEAVGITDHDTVGGIQEAIDAADGIIVVPGIEISCDVPSGVCHILGYYVDHNSPFLKEPLDFLRKRRRERADKIMERLHKLGFNISLEDRPDYASVGRPHIAAALVEGGYVFSYEEAFKRYLYDGGPAFIPSPQLLPHEAFDMILRSGGVPVLAHPHTFNNQAKIRSFARQGLLGIEARYAYYENRVIRKWSKLARELDLVITTGSDFHGRMRIDRPIGNVRSDISILDELKNKRRV